MITKRRAKRSAILFLFICQSAVFAQTQPARLAEVRRTFSTQLSRKDKENAAVDQPPPGVFDIVKYPTPAGDLAAYLSPDPKDGKKHPAIIWIFGGFSNSIGAAAWEKGPPANDQSASAFREAGLIMMYPSFRGGNQNPGVKECFLGEVDDVLAAADFLAKQSWVDPNRIYLGGHSTGGTMALLTAECSDRFRAVFAFGPVATPASYGADVLPFAANDKKELIVRAPIVWLQDIRCPVYVFEGKDKPSNASAITRMMQPSKNDKIQFHLVNGASHFSILAPVTKLVAERALHDDGPTAHINFSDEELDALFKK